MASGSLAIFGCAKILCQDCQNHEARGKNDNKKRWKSVSFEFYTSRVYIFWYFTLTMSVPDMKRVGKIICG